MKKDFNISLALAALILSAAIVVSAAEPASKNASLTIEASYPGLASGALTFATLGELPDGVLLKAGGIEIFSKDLDDVAAKSPEAVREQLRKNGFFLLEQIAAEKLLLLAIEAENPQTKIDLSGKVDNKIIQGHISNVVSKVEVTEEEIADFYNNNKDICGDAPLEKIKTDINGYLLNEKKQEAVKDYIKTLAQKIPAVVSLSWTKEQAVLAKDNPVDKARSSGRPSLIDFGADGCRPCDMMAPILDDLKKKYDFKFIDIVKEYAPDLTPVMCSPSELEQVLLNLFKNALHAMEEVEEDGYTPQFKIRLVKEPDFARIEIEDNGPGMPEEVRKRIFEPFFTTKPVGVGTGLGLSVSYMIITQNHSGTFECETALGKGTKFTIRLPL